jgi:hypothetical protein
MSEGVDNANLTLDARTITGHGLLTDMQDGCDLGSVEVLAVGNLPPSVDVALANIVFTARDCMDGVSETGIAGDEIQKDIDRIEAEGFCLCAAYRDGKLVDRGWEDRPPVRYRIAYLFAAPEDDLPAQVSVPRKAARARTS